MGDYVFFGRVLPERANVNLSPIEVGVSVCLGNSPSITLDSIRVAIEASQVTIVAKGAEGNWELGTLRNAVERFVQHLTDTLGFLWLVGYDVEITSAVSPTGESTVFGVGMPELSFDELSKCPSTADMLRLVLQYPELAGAVANLREALRAPADTPFFVCRAVESLARHFAVARGNATGETEKKDWDRMAQALRCDKSVTDHIKPLFANPVRHGAFFPLSGEQRTHMMQLAWKVVNRFAIYAQRGFADLDADEFRVLCER